MCLASLLVLYLLFVEVWLIGRCSGGWFVAGIWVLWWLVGQDVGVALWKGQLRNGTDSQEMKLKQQFKIKMHKYQLLQQIGHGAYSIVFKALNIVNNATVAIKRINHTNPDIAVVLNREIHTLKTLQHPNIIKLYEVFADQTYAYLVFEYLPFDLIAYYKEVKKCHNRNLTHDNITYIVWQMCQALAYMHFCGIMHRDIKPQNVLIDPATLKIKLIDFGFATQLNPYAQHTQYMITRWYRPLEIVLNLPYDAKADVFALGALVLELYQGEQIFRSASNLDQLYWILDICGYPSTWPQAIIRMSQLGINFDIRKEPQIYKMAKRLKPEAANLIIAMLQTSPLARISMGQILRHPYFSSFLELNTVRNERQYASNGLSSSQNLRLLNRNRINSALESQNALNKRPYQQQELNTFLSPSNSKNSLDLNLNLNRVGSNRKDFGNGQPSTERSKEEKSRQAYHTPLSQRRMSDNYKEFFSNIKKEKQEAQKSTFEKNFKFVLNHNEPQSLRHKTQGYDDGRNGFQFHELSSAHFMKAKKVEQESKGLKNRTKSYQGISVVSLKRNNSNNTIQKSPQISTAHLANYLTANSLQRKQPTFSKIRDKLVHETKPMGKIKISLTDRHQFHGDRRIGSHRFQ